MNIDKLNIEREELRKRFNKLSYITIVENWDNEWGKILTLKEWENVFDFCIELNNRIPLIDNPFIFSCGDGSIHLEWLFKNKIKFIVEIHKDHFIWSTKYLKNKKQFCKASKEESIQAIITFSNMDCVECNYSTTHCPKCNSCPHDHVMRNHDLMWHEGEIYCILCDTLIRYFDAG